MIFIIAHLVRAEAFIELFVIVEVVTKKKGTGGSCEEARRFLSRTDAGGVDLSPGFGTGVCPVRIMTGLSTDRVHALRFAPDDYWQGAGQRG